MDWKGDESFCEWMVSMNYVVRTEKGLKPFLTLGVVLYMYEAWQKRGEC